MNVSRLSKTLKRKGSEIFKQPPLKKQARGTNVPSVNVKKITALEEITSEADDQAQEHFLDETTEKIHIENKKTPKLSWFFSIPLSLQRKRLIYVIMIAYYLALFNEDADRTTWRILSALNSNVEEHYKEALTFAELYIKPFTQIIPSHLWEKESSINELHGSLHNQHISYCDNSGTYEFSCQFYIFHSYTGTLLSKIPEKFDPSLRQLYFAAETEDTGQLKNIGIIQNLLAFFRMFGVFCFFCEKFFRGHGTQHKCLKSATCFACRRPLLTSNMYVTKKTKSFFCDSGLCVNTAKECLKCNMRLLTPACTKHHNQRVCRWGVLCKNCEKYIYVSKFVAKDKILQSHVCGLHQCYFCGLSEKKTEHVCKINLPKFDNIFTNLGFLNFEFSGQSPLKCLDCFKQNSVCQFCSDNSKREVILCDVLLEKTKRGDFESYTFSSFGNIPAQHPSFKTKYFPDLIPTSLSERSKTKFGKATKNVVSEFKKESNSVLEQFFAMLLSHKIVNTTFILLDDSRNCFEEIIKCLFEHGLRPIVLGNPRIFVVEVPCLDIRFVNFENYVDDSMADLQNRFCTDLAIKYFPRRWIKECFLNFVGNPPKICDLAEYHDTTEITEEKKHVVTVFKNPWNFSTNLFKYSFSKCRSLAQAALEFVQESFQCQTQLKKTLLKDTHFFVHPFNKPLFTKASYSYKLLCVFCKDMENVRVVKQAIAMQSSKGELEFCAYTKWLHPTLHIQTAWSPRGQKHFPESFPDYYISNTRTCGFWNGCLVHGHPSQICRFKKHSLTKRNMFKIELGEAFASYEAKKEKLLKNHPEEVQHIEEMWHCEWAYKKATDSKLQHFLNTIYRNPPLYRLEPRAAGK